MRTHRLLTIATVLFVTSTAFGQLRGPTNQILIPAAGAVGGASGTFFRSDMTLTNFRDVDQRVQLQWLPRASGDSGAPSPVGVAPVYITIPAHSGIASEDFVTNYLQQTGLGAIEISGVTSANALDTGALLFATARIWSPQPGSTGNVSQTFPVVPVGAIDPSGAVIVLGHHIDDRYRTNVGIASLEPKFSLWFDIVQSTDDPTFAPVKTTVMVPPMSMVQVGLQNATSHVLQVTITRQPLPYPFPGPSNLWVAYASSVDNVTGDSWSSLAMPVLKP